MELRNAERRQAKIKLGLQGPSGSGKTYGALLIAYGLTNDWSKIAVIDTENHSADLYAHLGSYKVLSLTAPFTPEKYITAIRVCEKAGIEVVVIDSISHEWESAGGILDIHNDMPGNSFTNWGKLTPRHNAFINSMLQSSCHIIATIRAKQDYVLVEKNGKQVPEKVGLKGVTREGLDYEFTIVFVLDIKHNVSTSKDRTGLFVNHPEFKISPLIGNKILNWCLSGTDAKEIKTKITACTTVNELLNLYERYPEFNKTLKSEFITRKKALALGEQTKAITNNLTYHQNGSNR